MSELSVDELRCTLDHLEENGADPDVLSGLRAALDELEQRRGPEIGIAQAQLDSGRDDIVLEIEPGAVFQPEDLVYLGQNGRAATAGETLIGRVRRTTDIEGHQVVVITPDDTPITTDQLSIALDPSTLTVPPWDVIAQMGIPCGEIAPDPCAKVNDAQFVFHHPDYEMDGPPKMIENPDGTVVWQFPVRGRPRGCPDGSR